MKVFEVEIFFQSIGFQLELDSFHQFKMNFALIDQIYNYLGNKL